MSSINLKNTITFPIKNVFNFSLNNFFLKGLFPILATFLVTISLIFHERTTLSTRWNNARERIARTLLAISTALVKSYSRCWAVMNNFQNLSGGESSVLSFWLRRTILLHLYSSIARSHYIATSTILSLRFLPLCSIHLFFIDIFSYFFLSPGRITYSLDRNTRLTFVSKNRL